MRWAYRGVNIPKGNKLPGECLALDIAVGPAAGLAMNMVAWLAVGCHGKHRGNIPGPKHGVCHGRAMADGYSWALQRHATGFKQ